LRAMAKIFFGSESQEFQKSTTYSSVSDLSKSEILPATFILVPLFLIGILPLTISHRIDLDIGQRYSEFQSQSSSFKPSCCPDSEESTEEGNTLLP